jgi:hypothetical protein
MSSIFSGVEALDIELLAARRRDAGIAGEAIAASALAGANGLTTEIRWLQA